MQFSGVTAPIIEECHGESLASRISHVHKYDVAVAVIGPNRIWLKWRSGHTSVVDLAKGIKIFFQNSIFDLNE